MTLQEISTTRRAFLAATGGLVIGFALMPKVSAFAAEKVCRPEARIRW
jgi:isoquinoline 1-oxidoreductase subunit beta